MGTLTRGHTYQTGEVLTAANLNSEFDRILSTIIGGLDSDNIDSIYKAAFECARTYSYGGGIGVDISCLRPKDSIVHNAADSSTGAVSFME